MPGSGWAGSGVTTSENASSGSQVAPLSLDLRDHILVARNGRVTRGAAGALARVIPRGEESAGRANRKVRLPLRTGRGIGVQLERRAKGHTAVGGANVIDVARVSASAVLGIDQVNDVVEGSRLDPSPRAASSRRHR